MADRAVVFLVDGTFELFRCFHGAPRLPGVPGWGRVSAAAVLERYGTVEQIPDDAACWDVAVRGAARLAASLRERRLEAILYRNLSRLRTDVPIPHTLDDLEWRGAKRAELTAIAERLDATEVIEKIPRWLEE